MSNTGSAFFPTAIEIVTRAIDHDTAGEYEKALPLYDSALEWFMKGLRHEKNPATKESITKRVTKYMERAEELQKKVTSNSAATSAGSGSGGVASALPAFELEKYFALHEFSAKYLLGCSDAESIQMKYLLSLADEECKQLWDDLELGYTESRGLPLLNAEIAQLYKACHGTHVLGFAGAEEGIYATMKAILTKSPHDHCIVITPCYQSLKAIPASLCPNMSCLDLCLEDNWSLDIDALTALVIPGQTKLIVMNFPHNPTGSVLPRKTLDAVINLCRRNGIWLFSDEVYRGIERDPQDLNPPVVSLYEKGISLGVMSKAYGLAGLRIGWIVCTDMNMLDEISNVKHYLSICNSCSSEVLALIALRNANTILGRNLAITKENLQHINEFFENWKGCFSWVEPKGGCCGYVRYLLKGKMTLAELADVLITKYNILIIPGDMFPTAAMDGERDGIDSKNHFRLGFGRSNFKEALDALCAALREILVT